MSISSNARQADLAAAESSLISLVAVCIVSVFATDDGADDFEALVVALGDDAVSVFALPDTSLLPIPDDPKPPLTPVTEAVGKLKPNEGFSVLSTDSDPAGLAIGHCGADTFPKLKFVNGFAGVEDLSFVSPTFDTCFASIFTEVTPAFPDDASESVALAERDGVTALPVLKGDGAVFEIGGNDGAVEGAFAVDALPDMPNGVGALLDMGGNDDDDEEDTPTLLGDALDDDVPVKGVGAFVDMGGNDEDADVAVGFSSLGVCVD